MVKTLNRDIRDHLCNVLPIKPNTISVRLAEIKRVHYGITPAAAAQLLAQKYGKSILGFLNDEDKNSLARTTQPTIIRTSLIRNSLNVRTPAPKVILTFGTDNRFIRKHIDEINSAYNARCYTATFVLCRKVMENLIIEIMRNRFPKNRSLYEDSVRRRYLDFSVVLDNLFKQRAQFSINSSSGIERLKQISAPFKKEANNKTHSLFHVARKKELDEAEIQEIFDLIKTIITDIGLVL